MNVAQEPEMKPEDAAKAAQAARAASLEKGEEK